MHPMFLGTRQGTNLDFIEQVNPKTTIPIHTEHALTYKKWSSNVHLLEKAGDSFNLS